MGGLPHAILGEVMLLKLMHQLYDECDGGSSSTNAGGMRIDDVIELLSCCASHINDEISMEKEAEDLLTVSVILTNNIVCI